jgi:glycerol-3-phosphate dehydrogenase
VDGVEDASYSLFAHRYGYAARELLALVDERPDLRRPIAPGQPDLLAEAVFSARNEQARTVADVLLRRTRLGLLAARPLAGADSEPARAVADAMAGELGWDAARTGREVESWREVAAAEGIAVPADAGAGTAAAA